MTLNVGDVQWVTLGGDARGTGGLHGQGAGGKEGEDRCCDAGWGEGDPTSDLLERGYRRRLGDEAGEGEGGGREAGGREDGLGEGDLDTEAAAVTVVTEPLASRFENPAGTPPLEFGFLGDLGIGDWDEGVGGVLPQPFGGG